MEVSLNAGSVRIGLGLWSEVFCTNLLRVGDFRQGILRKAELLGPVWSVAGVS